MCQFTAEFVRRIANFPLYEDEYRTVARECLRDVQICAEQGVLQWTAQQANQVCESLQAIALAINGPWICFWLECESTHQIVPLALSEAQTNQLQREVRQARRSGKRCWIGFDDELAQRTLQLLGTHDEADIYCHDWSTFLCSTRDEADTGICFVNLDAIWETEGKQTSQADSCRSSLLPRDLPSASSAGGICGSFQFVASGLYAFVGARTSRLSVMRPHSSRACGTLKASRITIWPALARSGRLLVQRSCKPIRTLRNPLKARRAKMYL